MGFVPPAEDGAVGAEGFTPPAEDGAVASAGFQPPAEDSAVESARYQTPEWDPSAMMPTPSLLPAGGRYQVPGPTAQELQSPLFDAPSDAADIVRNHSLNVVRGTAGAPMQGSRFEQMLGGGIDRTLSALKVGPEMRALGATTASGLTLGVGRDALDEPGVVAGQDALADYNRSMLGNELGPFATGVMQAQATVAGESPQVIIPGGIAEAAGASAIKAAVPRIAVRAIGNAAEMTAMNAATNAAAAPRGQRVEAAIEGAKPRWDDPVWWAQTALFIGMPAAIGEVATRKANKTDNARAALMAARAEDAKFQKAVEDDLLKAVEQADTRTPVDDIGAGDHVRIVDGRANSEGIYEVTSIGPDGNYKLRGIELAKDHDATFSRNSVMLVPRSELPMTVRGMDEVIREESVRLLKEEMQGWKREAAESAGRQQRNAAIDHELNQRFRHILRAEWQPTLGIERQRTKESVTSQQRVVQDIQRGLDNMIDSLNQRFQPGSPTWNAGVREVTKLRDTVLAPAVAKLGDDQATLDWHNRIFDNPTKGPFLSDLDKAGQAEKKVPAKKTATAPPRRGDPSRTPAQNIENAIFDAVVKNNMQRSMAVILGHKKVTPELVQTVTGTDVRGAVTVIQHMKADGVIDKDGTVSPGATRRAREFLAGLNPTPTGTATPRRAMVKGEYVVRGKAGAVRRVVDEMELEGGGTARVRTDNLEAANKLQIIKAAYGDPQYPNLKPGEYIIANRLHEGNMEFPVHESELWPLGKDIPALDIREKPMVTSYDKGVVEAAMTTNRATRRHVETVHKVLTAATNGGKAILQTLEKLVPLHERGPGVLHHKLAEVQTAKRQSVVFDEVLRAARKNSPVLMTPEGGKKMMDVFSGKKTLEQAFGNDPASAQARQFVDEFIKEHEANSKKLEEFGVLDPDRETFRREGQLDRYLGRVYLSDILPNKMWPRLLKSRFHARLDEAARVISSAKIWDGEHPTTQAVANAIREHIGDPKVSLLGALEGMNASKLKDKKVVTATLNTSVHVEAIRKLKGELEIPVYRAAASISRQRMLIHLHTVAREMANDPSQQFFSLAKRDDLDPRQIPADPQQFGAMAGGHTTTEMYEAIMSPNKWMNFSFGFLRGIATFRKRNSVILNVKSWVNATMQTTNGMMMSGGMPLATNPKLAARRFSTAIDDIIAINDNPFLRTDPSQPGWNIQEARRHGADLSGHAANEMGAGQTRFMKDVLTHLKQEMNANGGNWYDALQTARDKFDQRVTKQWADDIGRGFDQIERVARAATFVGLREEFIAKHTYSGQFFSTMTDASRYAAERINKFFPNYGNPVPLAAAVRDNPLAAATLNNFLTPELEDIRIKFNFFKEIASGENKDSLVRAMLFYGSIAAVTGVGIQDDRYGPFQGGLLGLVNRINDPQWDKKVKAHDLNRTEAQRSYDSPLRIYLGPDGNGNPIPYDLAQGDPFANLVRGYKVEGVPMAVAQNLGMMPFTGAMSEGSARGTANTLMGRTPYVKEDVLSPGGVPKLMAQLALQEGGIPGTLAAGYRNYQRTNSNPFDPTGKYRTPMTPATAYAATFLSVGQPSGEAEVGGVTAELIGKGKRTPMANAREIYSNANLPDWYADYLAEKHAWEPMDRAFEVDEPKSKAWNDAYGNPPGLDSK